MGRKQLRYGAAYGFTPRGRAWRIGKAGCQTVVTPGSQVPIGEAAVDLIAGYAEGRRDISFIDRALPESQRGLGRRFDLDGSTSRSVAAASAGVDPESG